MAKTKAKNRARAHSKSRERMRAQARRFLRPQAHQAPDFAYPAPAAVSSNSAPSANSSSSPSASSFQASDAQLCWQGALCYSPMGQTRWVWKVVTAQGSRNAWVRFHFIQASLLSLLFLLLYALVGGLLMATVFLQLLPNAFVSPLVQLLLVIFGLHIALSLYLSLGALYGGTPGLPWAGEHAARLALECEDLEHCRLF